MKPFGEVIESSLSSFKVQCWQWDVLPAFASLIVIESNQSKTFGMVTSVQTGSLDAGRYPFPYQKTEEELRRDQPQIFALLQTHVSCVTLGYSQLSSLYYQLPPYPPRIHAFARLATNDELRLFFHDCAYLHVLCSSGEMPAPLEELLLALLKQLLDTNIMSDVQLQHFISTFSALSSSDYRKFKLFLQRIEALLASNSLKQSSVKIIEQ